MPTINQALNEEKALYAFGKPDSNHQKAAMRAPQICVKNASPPNNLAAKRSQGGV
ncbi:hypothetical protein J3D54_000246 [Pseudomonas sp. GGS8]|uniref:hypothetical protein n=1 Tax=Pseudomonas sp. GGS8 TaxID=2817892 RepID=UPI00209E8279|nr:hypothetical protein [Pseudomonas sp. GGS8]MCP1441114.1 hypothetical protein [Pseudomonas sp. GGS8]